MSKMGKIKAAGLSPRIVKIIEASRETRIAKDKTWSNADLGNDLYTAAVADPTIPDIKAWAHDQVRTWDEGLRPDPEQPGLSFYDAEAQIPLGGAKRIRMKHIAEPNQLLKWARIETQGYAKQTAAFNNKINYIVSRQEAWEKHPDCKSLDELEKRYFP
jgi:hypothetical protein